MSSFLDTKPDQADVEAFVDTLESECATLQGVVSNPPPRPMPNAFMFTITPVARAGAPQPNPQPTLDILAYCEALEFHVAKLRTLASLGKSPAPALTVKAAPLNHAPAASAPVTAATKAKTAQERLIAAQSEVSRINTRLAHWGNFAGIARPKEPRLTSDVEQSTEALEAYLPALREHERLAWERYKASGAERTAPTPAKAKTAPKAYTGPEPKNWTERVRATREGWKPAPAPESFTTQAMAGVAARKTKQSKN